MRKVIFLMHVSLDGFVAGPNGEMDWIVYNDDVEKYAHALHSQTDAAIYGRVTYQMMDSYWPSVLADPSANTQAAINHARWYDAATKIVFSRTLDGAGRKNTVVIKDNIAEQMNHIKQQPGKNIWLLGSPSIAQEFMRLNLIDEYRLNINPVVLGSGKPLYNNLTTKLPLKLLEAKTFQGGVTALRYEPERK